ncbi:DUF6341 family protein [Wenyingzhuangia sp. 2_MG-2023]|uniref:DUF6341 family protein n=1 Tax=Wenyingzhuangia sp. 2_MG-2023 TaxID=3062639 RepID=UPI0026E30AE4|nr:hypothetical protein [Wenyingzhuangia sp. 2_MG-2023]MDO6736590.1 hypothetical protein [Wenyingzhuangia sp. 2_MG-2023]MDO6801115.1 hypothetical protein [Wenyingzhuangia sp. 1_MG-2023]
MTALNIFHAIDDLFTNGILLPFKALRFSGNWWLSNAINFGFVIVLLVYLGYWMKESKKFKDEGTEDLPK